MGLVVPMNATGNIDRVRKLYAAYNARDWVAARGLLAADVEWFSAARGERVLGADGVLALLRSSADSFPGARIEVRALHEAGAHVIAECAFARESGDRGAPATFCEVSCFAEGKLVRGTTYADTLQILLELDCKSAA